MSQDQEKAEAFLDKVFAEARLKARREVTHPYDVVDALGAAIAYLTDVRTGVEVHIYPG